MAANNNDNNNDNDNKNSSYDNRAYYGQSHTDNGAYYTGVTYSDGNNTAATQDSSYSSPQLESFLREPHGHEQVAIGRKTRRDKWSGAEQAPEAAAKRVEEDMRNDAYNSENHYRSDDHGGGYYTGGTSSGNGYNGSGSGGGYYSGGTTYSNRAGYHGGSGGQYSGSGGSSQGSYSGQQSQPYGYYYHGSGDAGDGPTGKR